MMGNKQNPAKSLGVRVENCDLDPKTFSFQELVAYTTWTHYNTFNRYSSQTSDPIYMVKGRQYYFESLVGDGGGHYWMKVNN